MSRLQTRFASAAFFLCAFAVALLAHPQAAAQDASPPMSTEQLNPVFLNPQQEGGLKELCLSARDSLRQFADLQPVVTRNLINQLVAKSNAGFRNHDPAAELLQQKLPKIRQVNIYFFASENTTASWRGPDDTSGKGGIVAVLPNRYYYDPQQFYRNVASALINEPLASQDVATVAGYLGGAAALQVVAVKQFPIEIDYVDHGWDENGNMRKWPDEAVDFFRHLQEAIAYLKPRLEAIDSANRAALEQEIRGVENWLNSLGDTSATVTFGLYKGKDDAPPPKVVPSTRTILISCKGDEYIKAEKREYRWALWAKLIEGLNGLKGGSFDPGLASAIYDVLELYAKDKDNKLMVAWRLNSDLPAKPAGWPVLAGDSPGQGNTLTSSQAPSARQEIKESGRIAQQVADDAHLKPTATPTTITPFVVADITELLKGGVSSKRVAMLVQQRGVSFVLDEDSERKIRDAGGNAELLLVISKAKK